VEFPCFEKTTFWTPKFPFRFENGNIS
jgi:hypothetical protein